MQILPAVTSSSSCSHLHPFEPCHCTALASAPAVRDKYIAIGVGADLSDSCSILQILTTVVCAGPFLQRCARDRCLHTLIRYTACSKCFSQQGCTPLTRTFCFQLHACQPQVAITQADGDKEMVGYSPDAKVNCSLLKPPLCTDLGSTIQGYVLDLIGNSLI